MSWFNNLSIRAKLLVSFGCVLGFTAVLAVTNILALRSAGSRIDDLYTKNTLGIQYSLEANAKMIASAREEKRAFLSSDPAAQEALIAESRQEMEDAKHAADAYHATFIDDADAAAWADVETIMEKVIQARSEVLDTLAAGNREEALALAGAMSADIKQMNELLYAAALMNQEAGRQSADAARSASNQALLVSIVLSLVAIGAGMGLAYFVARKLSGAANEIAGAAASIAQGNTDVEVRVNSRDEMGRLANSFRDMTGYLKEMVGATQAVAAGDLRVSVRPRGSEDALGNALSQMVVNLR